ncbi:MAG: AmmeMemoRadiSam system protein B [Clostridia bacterium]|nr:AmmeMemoRadiSam system protein B [Clostridia bacterium]
MKKTLLLLLTILILLVGCSANDKSEQQTESADGQALFEHQSQPLNCDKFLSADQAQKLCAQAAQKQEKAAGDSRILVVPHHALAADLTAEALYKADAANKELFIIIGPNHANQGAKISVTDQSYQSGKTVLPPDKQALSALTENELAACDSSRFADEHSIGLPVALLAQLNPEARIVPIICRHSLTREEGAEIFSALAPLLNDKTLIIASIDFSHHLAAAQAADHNEHIAKLILDGKSERIAKLDSSYIDAPGIMAAVCDYAAKDELSPAILRKATAADYLGDGYTGEVTSYLTILYQ